jgi:hypothetical protein
MPDKQLGNNSYSLNMLDVSAVKARRKPLTTSAAASVTQHVAEEQQQQQLEQLQASLLDALQTYCQRPAAAQLQRQPIGGSSKEDSCRLELFLSTAASLEDSLQRAVEVAKRLPGFLQLPSRSQLTLLKANSLKLVLLCDILLDDDDRPCSLSTSGSPIATAASPPPLMTFLDGSYLSGSQAEALFSRDFADRYRRLKEHGGAQAAGLGPPAVSLLAAGLLLEGGNKDITSSSEEATAATKSLSSLVAAATGAVISPQDLEFVTSSVLTELREAAREMVEFFKIFRSFCGDSRQLPPVFVEVFDF